MHLAKDRHRFPGEVLLLAVFCQMLGGYLRCSMLFLWANALMIIFTGCRIFMCSSNGAPKQERSPAKAVTTVSHSTVKVSASRKAASSLEAAKLREKPAVAHANTSKEEPESSEAKVVTSKEKVQKKKQRSTETEKKSKAKAAPTTAKVPAPAPSSTPVPVAKTPNPAFAPEHEERRSREPEHVVDWVEYWNGDDPVNGGHVALSKGHASAHTSSNEIAIQTSPLNQTVTPAVTNLKSKHEKAQKFEMEGLQETLARLPSLGFAESCKKASTPVPRRDVPQVSELDMAAKFEEEARALEEEARLLEEEALRYIEQAKQRKNEALQEVPGAIDQGESSETDGEVAQGMSRTSSAARWADMDELDLDAPLGCPDFLRSGCCSRGAACPWQHDASIEQDPVHDVKVVEKQKLKTETSKDEVLYKRGMLFGV